MVAQSLARLASSPKHPGDSLPLFFFKLWSWGAMEGKGLVNKGEVFFFFFFKTQLFSNLALQ